MSGINVPYVPLSQQEQNNQGNSALGSIAFKDDVPSSEQDPSHERMESSSTKSASPAPSGSKPMTGKRRCSFSSLAETLKLKKFPCDTERLMKSDTVIHKQGK